MAVSVNLFIKNTSTEKDLPEVNPVKSVPSGETDRVMKQFMDIVKNPKVWFPAFTFGTINGSSLLFTWNFGFSYLIA